MKTKINCILSLLLALCVAAAAVPLHAQAAGGAAIGGIAEFTQTAQLYVYTDGQLNGEMSKKVEAGTLVTLEAPEVPGKQFNYWAVGKEDGAKASSLPTYKLAVNADTTVYAVYSDKSMSAEPFGAFTAAIKTTEGEDASIKLTATFSVPEDMTVSEAGIIYTSNLLLGVSGDADLTQDKIDGIDVKALLTSGKSNCRVRKSVASNEGLVTAYGDGQWSADSGTWALNQADWTLSMKAPGEKTPVYAVVYETVNGQTTYSDVFTAVYSELPSVSLTNSEIEAAMKDLIGH